MFIIWVLLCSGCNKNDYLVSKIFNKKCPLFFPTTGAFVHKWIYGKNLAWRTSFFKIMLCNLEKNLKIVIGMPWKELTDSHQYMSETFSHKLIKTKCCHCHIYMSVTLETNVKRHMRNRMRLNKAQWEDFNANKN